MMVQGYDFPAAIDREAVAFMQGGPFTLGGLREFIYRALPDGIFPASIAKSPAENRLCDRTRRTHIAERAADRFIQRERKLGNVAMVIPGRSPVWQWTIA